MKFVVLAFLVGITLIAPSPAAAEDTKPVARDWYGWQTLTVDGAAVALAVVTAGVNDGALRTGTGLASLGLYSLGAPIVHLAHRRPGAFGGSLGLRVGAPLLLGGVTFLVYNPRTSGDLDYRRGLATAVGAGIGVITSIVVDAVLFGRESPEGPPATGARVTPELAVTPGGGAAGAHSWTSAGDARQACLRRGRRRRRARGIRAWRRADRWLNTAVARHAGKRSGPSALIPLCDGSGAPARRT